MSQASTRRRDLSLMLLLATGLLTAGCGEERPAPPAGPEVASLRHLELRLTQDAPAEEAAEATVLEKLLPPVGVTPWQGFGDRVLQALVPAGPAERSLPGFTEVDGKLQAPAVIVLADAGKPREVRIPGSFDPTAFNQVVLRIAIPQEEELTLALYSGGEERARSVPVSVAGDPLPQLVVFDLPVLRSLSEPLSELRIQAAGHTQGLMVLEVAFAQSPLSSFLSSAAEPAQLIDLGGEQFDKRLGVGLFSGSPAEVVFQSEAGQALEFSYGVPRALRLPGSRAELRVIIETPGGSRVEETLPVASVRTEWRAAQLPIPGDGGDVRVTFELIGEAGAKEMCAIAEARVVARASTAPTVVLITSDTHRGDHIGALGKDAPVRTPAIDALAGRGVLFSDAYAASNTTNPSHTSLMTGVHVRDTRVLDNRSPLIGEARTLAEAFQEAGYHTLAAVSVRHLMDDESGLGQGFDRMSGPLEADRLARTTTTQVTSWLEELEGEPVFLWVHVFDAHSPYEPPASTDRRYYDKSRDPFDPERRLEFSGRFLPVYLRGLTDVEFPYAQYRAEVDALDTELGRVLTHPRLASAIVALTADHGESFGAHGIWWDHAGLYPDSLHIPLVLSWPGGPQGVRSDAPVQQMDLGRTLLDLAGHPEVEFRGEDLREALDRGATIGTRYSIAKDGNSASILSDGWQLNLNLRDHQPTAAVRERKLHQVELYDLSSDPKAERECASAHPERTRELRARLIDWLGRASARGFASNGQTTAAQRARLESLGYTGDGASEEARGGKWIDPECACAECEPFRQP